jgi:hypothetical protein
MTDHGLWTLIIFEALILSQEVFFQNIRLQYRLVNNQPSIESHQYSPSSMLFNAFASTFNVKDGCVAYHPQPSFKFILQSLSNLSDFKSSLLVRKYHSTPDSAGVLITQDGSKSPVARQLC